MDTAAPVKRKRGRPRKGEEGPPKEPSARDTQTKSALYHLTPQELRFVQAVAQGADNTAAIKAAGYRGDGTRAKVRAWRLMQKPVIRAAIYELMVQAFDKSSIEVTQWLREVAAIAFMPADMIEGKPRWSDKGKMLTVIGEFQKLLEKSAPNGKPPQSIVNLIVQAGTKVTHERGAAGGANPVPVDSGTG